MQHLYGTTALALVVPHYAASYIAQNLVPHLVLVNHVVFRFRFQRQELLVHAYEVRDVFANKGFGWHVTPAAAYASAFWGNFKPN